MNSTRWYRLFAAVLLASTLAACTVRGRAVYTVDQAPPAPRATTAETRPGMLWIQGHWEFVDGKWVWHDGVWRRERAGHEWVQGRWVDLHGRWQWHPGHWRGDVLVRDHRY